MRYFSFDGRTQMAADIPAHAALSTPRRSARIVPGFIRINTAPVPAKQLHPAMVPIRTLTDSPADAEPDLLFDFGELWNVFQVLSSR